MSNFLLEIPDGLPRGVHEIVINFPKAVIHLAILEAMNPAGNRLVSGLVTDLDGCELPIQIYNAEYRSPPAPPSKKGRKVKPEKPIASALCFFYQTWFLGAGRGDAHEKAAALIGYAPDRSTRNILSKGRNFITGWGGGP